MDSWRKAFGLSGAGQVWFWLLLVVDGKRKNCLYQLKAFKSTANRGSITFMGAPMDTPPLSTSFQVWDLVARNVLTTGHVGPYNPMTVLPTSTSTALPFAQSIPATWSGADSLPMLLGAGRPMVPPRLLPPGCLPFEHVHTMVYHCLKKYIYIYKSTFRHA